MPNCYKNIIKHFAQKLNEEQEQPIQEPVVQSEPEEVQQPAQEEEVVELTQAEKAPLAIELDDGTVLKHVEPLKGFSHIDVYVDEDDDNVKYVVSGAQDELEELAAQAWVKQVESGAFDCGAMPWKFIIEQGDTLGILDSKTAEMVAKALASSSLDAEGLKQTAEAIWGKDLKSLAEQIITFDGVDKTGFLSFEDPEFHDVKDNDDIFTMRYDFQI
jgi:hypothetical protein